MSRWSAGQIDTAIAQARKWASSADNGWAPTRPQVTVLADAVEDLRKQLDGVQYLLWDEAAKVASDNPHDGRTVAGRAWKEAAWLLHSAVRQKLRDGRP